MATPDPLVGLTALAAVTSRVGLLSSVLLGPPRGNAGLFANAAATLDAIAGPGRLRLGVALGARPADYAGSGIAFTERGRRFDSWIDDVRATWAGTSRTGFGHVWSACHYRRLGHYLWT